MARAPRALLVVVVLLAGCPGTSNPPAVDGRRLEGPIFVDGPPLRDGPGAERVGSDGVPGEGTPSPEGPVQNPCTATTPDGMAQNPGCDPDVQVNGLTAGGEFRNASGTAAWILTSGKKFWIYDPKGGAAGAFTAGGKDLSATLAGLPPTSCTVKSSDGLSINPSCDLEVQANGPSSIGEFVNPQTKAAAWLFTVKKKWWIFDPATGGFTAGGLSLAEAFLGFTPACTEKTSDGIALNPGCDPDFVANGATASSEFVNPQGGASAWLFTSGPKWWVLDPSTASFVAGGKSLATILVSGFQPASCATTTSDGLSLNPGCDTDLIANGPTMVGEFRGSGAQSAWLFTVGKKWWLYDPSPTVKAFVAGGKDLAAFLRTLKP
jgi:hypothetical protein